LNDLKIYKDKERKEPITSLDFPEDTIVNDGTTVETSAYLVNESPNDYEVFEISHDNIHVSIDVDFGSQTKPILKPNQPYKITVTWANPKGNDKPLKGFVKIHGRFIACPKRKK
jgi:hypothetical protein